MLSAPFMLKTGAVKVVGSCAERTFRKHGNDTVCRKLLSFQDFLSHLESDLDGHEMAADVRSLQRLPLAAATQPVLVFEVQEMLSLFNKTGCQWAWHKVDMHMNR